MRRIVKSREILYREWQGNRLITANIKTKVNLTPSVFAYIIV